MQMNELRNCLVLGAAGFIGRHLCQALCAAGHSVKGFDRLPLGGADAWPEISGVNWCAGDFLNQNDLRSALSGVDVVFHLVSSTVPKTSNEHPAIDLQENVAATLGLLDQIIRLPTPPRLIFLSSGGTVYGVPQVIPISETHPTEPLCAYGVGKLSIEKYIALYHHLHGIDYCILRLANPYGEFQSGRNGQGVIPVFLSRALKNETLQIWGDGEVVRDYFHIDDLSRALVRVVHSTGSQRFFNIGSGEGHSLNDLIAKIRCLLQKEVPCQYLSARACDVPVNVLDIQRAHQHLGWKPLISLDDGLLRTLAWLKAL